MSKTCTGHVSYMCWSCVKHVLDMFQTCAGHVSDKCWLSASHGWDTLWHVLVMFQTKFRHGSDMIWPCVKHVMATFHTPWPRSDTSLTPHPKRKRSFCENASEVSTNSPTTRVWFAEHLASVLCGHMGLPSALVRSKVVWENSIRTHSKNESDLVSSAKEKLRSRISVTG